MVFHGRSNPICASIAERNSYHEEDKSRLRKDLWNAYIWHRQTLHDLARRYDRSLRWVQIQLDASPIHVSEEKPQPIIAMADTTFFGRGYGVIVIRCPRLKKNVHFHEVQSETPEEYHRARQVLEEAGWIIEAAVIDGRQGLAQVFSDVPVQMCQFHQIAIVRRYLTSNPKLPAGKELRVLTQTLSRTDETTFTFRLTSWFKKWDTFLKERTYHANGRNWQYTS